MFTLVFALLLFPTEETGNLADLLEKAGPEYSKKVRIAALKKLADVKAKEGATICKTLEQHAAEKDADIRREVMIALGLVALNNDLECPLAVVAAINDENEPVSVNAGALAGLFKKLPKPAIPIILQAAKSDKPFVRESAARLLEKVARTTPRAAQRLKDLMNDSNEFVRDAAHESHFVATQDFSVYVTHLLVVTADRVKKTPEN